MPVLRKSTVCPCSRGGGIAVQHAPPQVDAGGVRHQTGWEYRGDRRGTQPTGDHQLGTQCGGHGGAATEGT